MAGRANVVAKRATASGVAAAAKEALQRSVAANAAYALSREQELQVKADAWRQRAEALWAELDALAPRFDPEAAAALQALRAARASVADLAPPRVPAAPDPDEHRSRQRLDDRIESILHAADDLDETLVAHGAALRDDLERVRDRAGAVTALLAVLGAVAVISVARLTVRERRARMAAQAAVRARDEVVAIVSHDLRNPLNTILLAASTLLELLPAPSDRPMERRSAEIIKRAGEGMNRLIRDLLDVTRVESGGLAIEKGPVPVAPLLDEARTMLTPVVTKQGHALEIAADDALPAVAADRDRLLQAFSNLVGNAAKFTAAGAGSSCPPAAIRRASGSRSATPAAGSRPRTSRTCSTASGRRAVRTAGASASACRS